MLFSEVQLLVSDKLKREASARHDGKKILQKRCYQDGSPVETVFWCSVKYCDARC